MVFSIELRHANQSHYEFPECQCSVPNSFPIFCQSRFYCCAWTVPFFAADPLEHPSPFSVCALSVSSSEDFECQMITELWQIWQTADRVPFLSAGLDSRLTTLTFSRSILSPLCCQQVSRSDMQWTQLSAFDVLRLGMPRKCYSSPHCLTASVFLSSGHLQLHMCQLRPLSAVRADFTQKHKIAVRESNTTTPPNLSHFQSLIMFLKKMMWYDMIHHYI